MSTSSSEPVAHGIDNLIESLRSQGVEAGKQEGELLLAEARSEAERIIAFAQKEAEALLKDAHKEADFVRDAGQQALEMAHRNIVLELKTELQHEFAARIRATVRTALKDETLLKQMILEIAGKNRVDEKEKVEVLLPAALIGVEDLRKAPEKATKGTLMHFVAAESAELLREGVTLNVTDDNQHAMVLKLQDKDVEVTLSSETIAQMLLAHLQPRFRALCEGLVG